MNLLNKFEITLQKANFTKREIKQKYIGAVYGICIGYFLRGVIHKYIVEYSLDITLGIIIFLFIFTVINMIEKES